MSYQIDELQVERQEGVSQIKITVHVEVHMTPEDWVDLARVEGATKAFVTAITNRKVR